MIGYLKLIGYTLVLYLCAYGIISRICTCVERYIEYKYRARFDTEWANSQFSKKSGRASDRKEGNRDV